MKPLLRLVTLASLALFQATAAAQLSIEITGSGADRLPVAIAEFAGDPAQSKILTATVRSDLERSGLFKLIDVGSKPIAETTTPDFAGWRDQGADALVGGSLLPTSDNRVETRLRLFDAARQQNLGGILLVSPPTQLRSAAHRVSDFVYEKLTGERGVFSTRIAYVVKRGSRFELQIADADGQNPQPALESPEPIISPTWSPDGKSLAYVSFEKRKPIIYVHSLASGRRHVVANFKGSNSAPAWSPDGKTLVVVLTKEGGSQLFTVNADGSGVRRLARSPSIDTEPRYSPDGAWIYFTSDRGGSPQVYRIPAAGGDAQRITFEGAYNVTPRPSPDGKSMAYITSTGNKFQLAVMDLASRQTQILTDSDKDESPTYSPNGRMILFATEIGGRGVLSAVSVDGRVKQRLSVAAGDVREPTWGPYPR